MKMNIYQRMVACVCVWIVMLSIQSCCTDVACMGADDLSMIYFYDFAASDVDTVLVEKFEKGNGFKNVVDTQELVSQYTGGNPGMALLSENISVSYDYRITLASTGQTFTLSGFLVKEEDCGRGFLCNNRFNALKSYAVNGVVQSDYQLSIHN